MAYRTIQLRKQIDYIIKGDYNLNVLSASDRIDRAIPYIFNFDYPIFDEKYRHVLNAKILKRYYLMELGSETYPEWHFMLEEFMQRRMPYYNRLYVSAMVNDYDPFDDIGYKDSYTRSNESNRDRFEKNHYVDNTKTDGTNHSVSDTGNKITSHDSGTSDTITNEKGTSNVGGESNNTGHESTKNHAEGLDNRRTINEDTPQSNIEVSEKHASGISVVNGNDTKDSTGEADTTNKVTTNEDTTTNQDGTSNTKTDQYGEANSDTNVKANASAHSNVDGKGDSSTNGNEKFNNTEEYLFERHGRNGSHTVGKLIADQRANIIDVDTMLIDEMRDLFLLTYPY